MEKIKKYLILSLKTLSSYCAGTGSSKMIPWNPSITCGPLVPRPRIKRPFEREFIESAPIAVFVAVLEPICNIPVPSFILDVFVSMFFDEVNV